MALVARDAAAVTMRALRPGDPVDARWTATAPDTPPLRVALGALALVRGGAPWPGLQTSERAPRTAVGLSADGRTLFLVAVDGRQQASVGATLAELGRLVVELGIPQAVALDGGGSTQMVRRPAGGRLVVVNAPSQTPLRPVADGLAVVPAGLTKNPDPDGNTRPGVVVGSGVRAGRHVPPGLINKCRQGRSFG